jgi:hypothetical protein
MENSTKPEIRVKIITGKEVFYLIGISLIQCATNIH